MISHAGLMNFKAILETFKKNEEEQSLDQREIARSHFESQISHLKNQAELLRKEANKIGEAGLMNFFSGMLNLAFSTALDFIGNFQSSMNLKLNKILSFGLKIGQGIIGHLQKFLNSGHQKLLKKLQAQGKEEGIRAQINQEKYDFYKKESQNSQKRAQESKEILRTALREINEAHEAMIF